MENSEDIRLTQSEVLSNALAPMDKVPNCILRRKSDSSFCTTYKKAVRAMQKPMSTLDASLESDNEASPSLSTQRLVPAPYLTIPNQSLLFYLKFAI